MSFAQREEMKNTSSGNWQFSLADLLAMMAFTAIFVASYAELGTRAQELFIDLWPSYVTYGPSWPNGFRHYYYPMAAGWIGLAGLLLTPVVAVAVVVELFRAGPRSRFLGLIPCGVAGFPILIVLGMAGWNNAFPNYAPYCVLLMLYASVFTLAEFRWRRLHRSTFLMAIAGLLASFACYCALVAMRFLAAGTA